MTVAHMAHDRLTLPATFAAVIGVGGILAIFATYWDEAWHTDIGRDTFWAPPHLLLYGAIAIVGLSVAGWGIAQLVAARSLRIAVSNRPLLAAGAGALGALVAAPLDGLWHEAYGRDAVLWSPPHMLAVFGAIAMVFGVLAGLPADRPGLRVGAGVLLLANALTVVFEYETDVPQFSEVFYLPLLVGVGLGVAAALDKVVPRRGAVTTMVLGYVVVRLGVMAGLAGLGRSLPDVPVAIVGLALWDIPRTSRPKKAAAAVIGMTALELLASASGVASQPLAAVATVAVPLMIVATTVLIVGTWRAGGVLAAVAVGAALILVPAKPAAAHDPGQGEPVVSVELTAVVDGRQVIMTASPAEHCDDLRPLRIVARRAGEKVSTPLQADEKCSFSASVTVPATGRWFIYVEFEHDDETLEAWLPVAAGTRGYQAEQRVLYVPAGGGKAVSAGQVGFGGMIYLAGLLLVALGWSALRTAERKTDGPA